MNREVHALASFVHGALAFGHFLGIVYNWRRRNRWDVLLHSAGVAYGVRSALHHARSDQP